MRVDYLVVISPAVIQKGKKFCFPQKLGGLYLGGRVRMLAVAQYHRLYPDAEIILVGGYYLHQGRLCRETETARRYLLAMCPQARVTVVDTLPCTFHNFVGLFWQRPEIAAKATALLTNDYHRERALALWKLASFLFPGMPTSPVTVLPAAETPLMLRRLQVDRAFRARVTAERIGLADLHQCEYRDSCLENRPLIAALRKAGVNLHKLFCP